MWFGEETRDADTLVSTYFWTHGVLSNTFRGKCHFQVGVQYTVATLCVKSM